MAHDLRTPLGVVVLSRNALREALPEGPDGEEARALNAMVERAASQMGRLIRDLLDASSIEAGRLRFDIQEHDAAALLADAADLLARHWSGRGKAGADTGLGLYIAKGIVEAHDGQISLAPETGGGTAFSFTLPRSPSRIAARD